MDKNTAVNGAYINEGAESKPPYKKKGMPKGAKIAIIIVSIVLVVALLFGALFTAILGFFGVLVLLVAYLVTPENDGTFEYGVHGDTVEIVGLVDDGFSGTLHIPAEIDGRTVTEIGFEAFAESNIEVVYLPDTIELIDSYAFWRCRNLREVYMGDNVTSIEGACFIGCSSLEYIKISENLTSMGYSAFSGCTSLKSIKIPASVTLIDDNAFIGCENLSAVYFEDPYGWSALTYSYDEDQMTELDPNALSDPYLAAELINLYNDYCWEKTIE